MLVKLIEDAKNRPNGPPSTRNTQMSHNVNLSGSTSTALSDMAQATPGPAAIETEGDLLGQSKDADEDSVQLVAGSENLDGQPALDTPTQPDIVMLDGESIDEPNASTIKSTAPSDQEEEEHPPAAPTAVMSELVATTAESLQQPIPNVPPAPLGLRFNGHHPHQRHHHQSSSSSYAGRPHGPPHHVHHATHMNDIDQVIRRIELGAAAGTPSLTRSHSSSNDYRPSSSGDYRPGSHSLPTAPPHRLSGPEGKRIAEEEGMDTGVKKTRV